MLYGEFEHISQHDDTGLNINVAVIKQKKSETYIIHASDKLLFQKKNEQNNIQWNFNMK